MRDPLRLYSTGFKHTGRRVVLTFVIIIGLIAWAGVEFCGRVA